MGIDGAVFREYGGLIGSLGIRMSPCDDPTAAQERDRLPRQIQARETQVSGLGVPDTCRSGVVRHRVENAFHFDLTATAAGSFSVNRLPQFHQSPNRARTMSRASTVEPLVLFWSEVFQELSIAASHAHGGADWALSAGKTV